MARQIHLRNVFVREKGARQQFDGASAGVTPHLAQPFRMPRNERCKQKCQSRNQRDAFFTFWQYSGIKTTEQQSVGRCKIVLDFPKSIFDDALLDESVIALGFTSPDLIEVVFCTNVFGLRSKDGFQPTSIAPYNAEIARVIGIRFEIKTGT